MYFLGVLAYYVKHMQYDPDMYGNQRGAAQSSQYGGYQTVGGSSNSKAASGSMVMAVFSLLNILFLAVAAIYSVGIVKNDEATTDGTSFLVMAIMTLIAAGLGIFCSYVGRKLAFTGMVGGLAEIHKVFMFVIVGLSVIVMIGPIFR